MKSKKTDIRIFLKRFYPYLIPLVFLLILFVYVAAELRVIAWGIPGPTTAYPYEMDEWHHFTAVVALFKHFSNNIVGAERGPSFFFIVSGIYLLPFVIFHVIHPSMLAHHFTPAGLTELSRVFIILRSLSLLFGVLTLVLVYFISKRQLHVNPLITVLLLGVTPLWISWSDIYKYDIAVTFWISFTLYLLLTYRNNSKRITYWLSGFVAGLAIATKVSALPLIPLYILAFFLFTHKPHRELKTLYIGLIIFGLSFALFGITDVIFLGASWGEYIAVDVAEKPNGIFGMPWYLFLLFEHYPIIFGQGLYLLILVSIIYYFTKLRNVLKKGFIKKYNQLIFLASGLILFCVSLFTLGIGAEGQRMLVVLPFIALLSGYAASRLVTIKKYIFIPFLCLIIAVQLFESYAFLAVKLGTDPRAASSQWIIKNIKSKSTIALENIPIYQGIPNILLNDFYQSQNSGNKGIYNYQVVGNKIERMPDYAVITNSEDTQNFVFHSTKKLLLADMQKKGYKQVASFSLDHTLYSYFGDERNFFYSQITPYTSIEIYRKNNWTKQKH